VAGPTWAHLLLCCLTTHECRLRLACSCVEISATCTVQAALARQTLTLGAAAAALQPVH
jgi:hypothetical protein